MESAVLFSAPTMNHAVCIYVSTVFQTITAARKAYLLALVLECVFSQPPLILGGKASAPLSKSKRLRLGRGRGGELTWKWQVCVHLTSGGQ